MPRARFAAIAVALACGVAGCANVEAMRFYHSGTDALDRGEPQRAVADLEQAAALAPEVSAIQNHLGIAYEETGRSNDALHAYERAVALDCGNRAAETNLQELRAKEASESVVGDRELDERRSAADADEPNTDRGASR